MSVTLTKAEMDSRTFAIRLTLTDFIMLIAATDTALDPCPPPDQRDAQDERMYGDLTAVGRKLRDALRANGCEVPDYEELAAEQDAADGGEA